MKRNGTNRLPENAKKRTVQTHLYKRYEKQVPGHYVQVDVKFLNFNKADGKVTRRFQYTAIDDVTRVKALKIYERHSQANAIDFINYVEESFLFEYEQSEQVMGTNSRQNSTGMYMILVCTMSI